MTYLSPVHGDLHAGNILVNPAKSEVYLIDFANVQADGHIFKDFVKLEANILFRLYDYDASKSSSQMASEWLPFVGSLLGYKVTARNSREEQKAAVCIRELRSRARALKKDVFHSKQWAYEYLTGVLHWTLSSVYWINIFPSKKQLAFYTACLIAQRMQEIANGKRLAMFD